MENEPEGVTEAAVDATADPAERPAEDVGSAVTTIELTGIQIRSLEKARLLANALETIEDECGIMGTYVSIKSCYIADSDQLSRLDRTRMERTLRRILNPPADA